jgi:hypothetical protein
VNDLLVAFVTLIISGPTGFFWGKRQGVEQARYEERVRVISGFRERVALFKRAVQDLVWATEHQDRLEKLGVVRTRMEELETYYSGNDHVVPAEARYGATETISAARSHFLEFDSLLRYPEGVIGQRDWIQAHERWDKESPSLSRTFDDEARRTLGTERPWWRRVFGG